MSDEHKRVLDILIAMHEIGSQHVSDKRINFTLDFLYSNLLTVNDMRVILKCLNEDAELDDPASNRIIPAKREINPHKYHREGCFHISTLSSGFSDTGVHVGTLPEDIYMAGRNLADDTMVELLALGKPYGDIFGADHFLYDAKDAEIRGWT